MAKDIDGLLKALADAPEPRSLEGLESAVWSRIERSDPAYSVARVDSLLQRLAQRVETRSLANLEPHVWARIEGRGRPSFGGSLGFQAAVAAGALALGVFLSAGASEPSIHRSETVLLSEDAVLAPSVMVEGGA